MDPQLLEGLPATLKEVIEERLRPREEIMMVRRLMALEIGQSLGEAKPPRHPLALVVHDAELPESSRLEGLPKEYVEAVQRNVRARRQFAKAQDEHRELMKSLEKPDDPESDLLDLHLELAKLQREHEKLVIAHKYLDQLQNQPAASPDFLDPDIMYKDCVPLPQMPQQMVDGFAVDHRGTDAEVNELFWNVKKSVLRSKLAARQQTQRFDQMQARRPMEPSNLSPEAKLHALSAVKDTLVTWIETQLSKAGDDEGDVAHEVSEKVLLNRERDFEAQLVNIQEKYKQHIELRQQILDLLAQRDQIKKSSQPEKKQEFPRDDRRVSNSSPLGYLVTPYVHQLQALSREQKALIQERAHINTSIAKQQETTRRALDHLVEESQLLPQYPAAKSSKPKLDFTQTTKSAGRATITSQVQPWIYAADSAKIATLETVAEKVEEGMMSIDESRQALEELCKLMNVKMPDDMDNGVEQTGGQDGKDTEHNIPMSPRKAIERKEEKALKSIWDILDGKIGSIKD